MTADGDRQGPRWTSTLVGHGAAESVFVDTFAGGRMHHAWLVAGPKGIGKATLAFRLARFVLKHPTGARPGVSTALDADDPVFRRVGAGGHSDLMVLERTINERTKKLRSEISADDARGVSPFLRLTAGEGGWRIVIVDAADELNRESANALLKVLEEPPRRALLLLISHNPDRLLPTIRSRCRRLQLQPLPEPDIVALLQSSQPSLGHDDALLLTRLAEGSPGTAMRLAEQGGGDLFRTMLDLLGPLPRLDLAKLHAFADRLNPPAAEPAFVAFKGLYAWWLGRAMRAANGMTAEMVPGEAALLERIAAAAKLDRLLPLWEKTATLFDRAEAVSLERKQVVLETLLGLQAAMRARS